MAQRMLIDATRPEETRVVVVSGNRVEEFDYETATKTQIKGNIYLAKITRVEPSLQAAFVEYGGNRHGFLPFSEIHPDYYRLPIADREKLIAEEAAERARQGERAEAAAEEGDEDAPESAMDRAVVQEVPEEPAEGNGNGEGPESVEMIATETSVDTVGGDDIEDAARRRAQLLRRYKIQEVVKRRQVMLVQVTKEERGNKGAALTTYLSLAGRYCVLMPNTAKGGGISRKIASATDRRRLKSVVSEMDIPEGMAVIVRTAGSQRTKTEIRRDYEYLLRLWDDIRNKTLESTAPSLVHEEANLIKRAVRDIYTREMEKVLVEGEEGYKAARSVMRMLMPSHVKKIELYAEPTAPLFHKYRVEEQLEAMHAHTVQLRSGGSIVLSPTEALVAIDVNSGKATGERHIEETAYKTNLEAADEIARQLRLRDLAGLIVIDFIDMEESRHNREVERRLKEAMKLDRARIQLGRISPFGLLELSRQRLRPSLFETVNVVCPTCRGLGHLRSPDSLSLSLLRQVADEAVRRGAGRIEVQAPAALALYLLNEKRRHVQELEARFGITLLVRVDEALGAQEFVLRRLTTESRGEGPGEERRVDAQKAAAIAAIAEAEAEDAEIEEEEAEEEEERERPARAEGRAEGERRGRRRRGGRGRSERETPRPAQASADEEEPAEAGTQQARPSADEGEDDEERGGKRRRRGRRGGRRRRARREQGELGADQQQEEGVSGSDDAESDGAESEDGGVAPTPVAAEAAREAPSEVVAEPPGEESVAAPKRSRRSRKKAEPAPAEAEAVAAPEPEAQSEPEPEVAAAPAKPKRSRRKAAVVEPESAPEAVAEAPAAETPAAEAEEKPKRKRSPRRKKAEEPAAETPAEAAAEPAPAPVPEAAPEAPAEAPAEAPTEADAAEAEAEPEVARPRRRGWWSRSA